MYSFSQSQLFVIFFIIGVSIGLFFDFFRALRKVFKTPDIITKLEDLIFLGISGIFLIYNVVKLNNGELRLFIFIAVFFGILIYSLTISKICVIILSIIVDLWKKIFINPMFMLKKHIKCRKKEGK